MDFFFKNLLQFSTRHFSRKITNFARPEKINNLFFVPYKSIRNGIVSIFQHYHFPEIVHDQFM
jgi:hypothetical protein